jgi:hypothetical protein
LHPRADQRNALAGEEKAVVPGSEGPKNIAQTACIARIKNLCIHCLPELLSLCSLSAPKLRDFSCYHSEEPKDEEIKMNAALLHRLRKIASFYQVPSWKV